MYKTEFDKLLQKNTLTKNFIFFGEGVFFIDYYTKLLSQIPDANFLSFYFDEYDFTLAKNHLSQASLFGGTNLLVIKSEKKLPKKELETLFELTNKGDNRFIYAYYGKDHKSYNNAFAKLQVTTVRFFHPNHHEAITILQNYAKKLHLDIDHYTLNHLLQIQHNNISLAISELYKLSIFQTEQITNKTIDELVYGSATIDLQTVIKKILTKQPFIHDLETLLEQGEDEIKIITSILANIQELFLFNSYIRIHGKADAKAILGYTPPQFIVQEKAQQAMKIKPETFYKLFHLLLETELELKTTHCDKKATLQACCMKLQKII